MFCDDGGQRVEQIGDKLSIVERQVTSDLERFKKLTEDQG